MDFIDEIQALKTRLAPRKDHVQTEEATKTSLIMPFINALGVCPRNNILNDMRH